MTLLAEIIAHKKEEVASRRRVRSVPSLRHDFEGAARGFGAAVSGEGLSVIAEFKRKSPSRGEIGRSVDPVRVAEAYVDSGAAALSVLTDGRYFGGSAEDLRSVRAAVPVPVLRKEFVVDEYQIHESRAIGADAVLLIVRILSVGQLRDYSALVGDLGMDVLVEVHNRCELDQAIECGAGIIGINNRNLETLAVDLGTAERLRRFVPADRVAVAESGIRTADDLRRMADAGFAAALVGETCMAADDPGVKLSSLLEGVS